MQVVLRSFEKRLLQELGYGLDFARDASSGAVLVAHDNYLLDLESGFVAIGDGHGNEAYTGAVLLDIGAEDFDSAATRRAAKEIFRRALTSHLGPKPLTSRRLLFREAR